MKKAIFVASMLLIGILLFGCASIKNTGYSDNYTYDYTNEGTNYTSENLENFSPFFTANNTGNNTEIALPENLSSTGTYKGGPIFINGDKAFTSANGVVKGSGTSADPYIIEGWTIDASTANDSVQPWVLYGISVYDTSKYFVIRNCRVENSPGSGFGIGLSSLSNGKIENCTITNVRTGISVDGSKNITVSGNTIVSCEDGISTGNYPSNNVTISNNLLTNSKGTSIVFHNNKNSYVTNNTIRNDSGNAGIRVTASINSTISDNVVQGGKYDGIEVSASSWRDGDRNVISNNVVSGNGGTGLSIGGSYDTIAYNTANGNGRGIDLGTVNSVFSNNTANNNQEIGIFVSSVNTTISYNTFVSNNAVKDFYRDGTPYWVDVYFDYLADKKNTFKDNTYGTTNPS